MTKWAKGEARRDPDAFAPCGHGLVHEPHIIRDKKSPDKTKICNGLPYNKKLNITYKY